jgi:hypothetical protein
MTWQHQLLEQWVDLVLQVANTPYDEQIVHVVHHQVQAALADVIKGGPGIWPGAPGPPSDIALPPLAIRILRGRTAVVARAPELPEEQPANWDLRSGPGLEAIADQLLAVVMLLAHDPYAQRLRRCDWHECRRFYFATRDHRRTHSFCSEAHRRLFDLATRDPKAAAAYMKQWRAAVARKKGRRATGRTKR